MPPRRPKSKARLSWLQPAIVTGTTLPFLVIAYRAQTGELGANPIATAMNQLGLLALILLVSSLACTPLKLVTGMKWPMRLRKTLGLAGFFAVLAHFLVYLLFDQLLLIGAIIDDVLNRPFIAVGMAAFLLLIPLALTSTKNALKELGPKRWQRLHRLAYVAAGLGVVHFFIRVKKDITEPLIFAGVLGLLMGLRALKLVRRRRSS